MAFEQEEETLYGEMRRFADTPQLDFDRLWEDNYSDYFQNIARRWSYLQEDGSAEDLFQDLWLKVWTKAVDRWPDYHAKSKSPNFDAWVKFLLRNYITDIARRKKTGPQQMLQKQRSLDAPVETEEGSATLLDFMSTLDRAFEHIESSEILEKILDSLDDPDLRTAINVLVADEPHGYTAKLERIKELTGRSPSQIMRLLRENPKVQSLLGYTGPKIVEEPEVVEEEEPVI